MVVELDEVIQARLSREASLLGLEPEQLVARLVRSALDTETLQDVPATPGALRALDAKLAGRLGQLDQRTLEHRREAMNALMTFSEDNSVHLAPGVTVRELIEDGRR